MHPPSTLPQHLPTKDPRFLGVNGEYSLHKYILLYSVLVVSFVRLKGELELGKANRANVNTVFPQSRHIRIPRPK